MLDNLLSIAVIGAGGVGGYFGARLAQAGNDVTVVARNEHLQAIENNGLTVKSIFGDFQVSDVGATDSINSIHQPDLVILGVSMVSGIVLKTLSAIDALPYQATFSLARDANDGQRSEVKYQNGTVVWLAQKHGVDVPVNRFIY